MLDTSRTISGTSREWLSHFIALVSPAVEVAGHKVLDPLPCHFDLQQVGAVAPFLAFDLKASSISLFMMAKDDDRDKHPWNEGPGHGGQ
jgi:hypothetical protein